jgi:ABC-type polysaccharide/polyol phosphate transport system ATPase subunit
MSEPIAIEVQDVWKKFRLYHERNQSLKAIVVRGRRARYNEFDALKGVTLQVPEGQTFGLIGENGSGKSTLLKCIARILEPDRGSIHSRGKISALLELGAGFHPELSGQENIFLNGAILGVPKKVLASRLDDIVGFAGLEDFIDIPVKNYSSGMYVRLGFSVAINVDPDILLVDEVLAVGDEQFQRKCSEKFAELKEKGKTIVVVSHALGAMRSLCDNLALLEHGNLVKVGSAAEVVDQYLGDVHEDREAEKGQGVRWGSGEGRIAKVELLDHDGRPVTTVRTGDAVTFRIHYLMARPIAKPVFGLTIFTIDGVQVTGPNTKEADCVPEVLDGGGYVDLHVDRLLLVRGIFDVSVSLFDYSILHSYDTRHRAFRFDVERGEPGEQNGPVSLGGTWRIPTADKTR